MFDGAIAQAVLEHVADPYRCVAELHRVLKPDALVYAEIPLCNRFTAAARILRGSRIWVCSGFPPFPRVSSGACCVREWRWRGSMQYFWLSFTTTGSCAK